MSLDVVVMSFDAMWLLVLCHVTWCDAMSCDVRSRGELSFIVPCNGMECYERKTPLVVRSRCVVWGGSVTMWWSKSIFLYYKVLLQYYSSTTPVVLRTAKYCSTTLYYKVLLQYYSVPQSTAAVLLVPAAPLTLLVRSWRRFWIEECNIWRSGYSPKFHKMLGLQRKVTLHLHQILRLPGKKWISWLIRLTHETSLTMRGATRVSLQLHQILSGYLPKFATCCAWKVTLRHHQLLSLPRNVTLQHHQMLRLPRKLTLHLHQVLRLSRKMHSTLLYASTLYSSILCGSILYTSILYSPILVNF